MSKFEIMREEIPRLLSREAERWERCDHCILRKERSRLVYGSGRFEIPLFILGLSPGADEDVHGVPFIGKAGKLLRETWDDIGVDMREFFATNLIACRPPKNRTPQPSEVHYCRRRFDRAVLILEPKIVLVLGAVAMASSIGCLGVEKNRGRVRSGHFFIDQEGGEPTETTREVPAIGTYHPAALLRSHPKKQAEAFRADLELALEKARE